MLRLCPLWLPETESAKLTSVTDTTFHNFMNILYRRVSIAQGAFTNSAGSSGSLRKSQNAIPPQSGQTIQQLLPRLERRS